MYRLLRGNSDTEHDAIIKSEQESPLSTPKRAKGGKMAELKALISKRGAVKGKMSRIHTAVDAALVDPLAMSIAQLRVHSRNVEKYYGEFNEVHDAVMQSVHDNQKEAQEAKLVEFEELYNEVQVAIETLMEAHALNANRERAMVAAPGQPNDQPQIVIHQQALRAPLPTFDGQYENWPKFRSMFQDLMRNSPDSDAVKLFHLDKSLVGSAAGIIDAKTIQDNNYQQAWQILEQRYENKRLIIDVHVQGIMQLKKVAKKSSKELRSLIDECSRHVENLKFHGQPLEGVSELIVIHILSAAVDQETRELWEATIEHGDLPNYDDTMEFLRKRCLILERCESTAPALPSSKQTASKAASSVKASKIFAAATTSSEVVCELCGGDHPNFKCSTFKNMSIAQRLAKAKDSRVCFNCLRKGHMIRSCPSQRTCPKCQQKHHSLLHQDQFENPALQKSKDKSEETAAERLEVNGKADSVPQENGSVSVATSCVGGEHLRSKKQVLLQTAVIDIIDARGCLHPCRALLDTGSQAHILSEAMAKVLGLPTLKCNITVVGANGAKTQVKKGLNLNFASRYSALQDSITCLISDRPTGTVPSVAIDVSSWNIPPGMQLADPDFFKPSEVDLVLASNYVWDLLRSKKVVLANGTASLRETDLGWIITGTYDPYQQVSGTILLSNVVVQDPLVELLERFWSVEEVAETSPLTIEEEEVEQHFVETYRRDESGRFVVQMPFRETVTELEDNRSLALKRFFTLERKLSRNPDLHSQYLDFMREYELLGHCKEIKEEDDVRGQPRYYLPHHAVFKLTSSSTKVRVVFDASAKASKYSLNDVMQTGPTVQNDIFTVNLHFRQHVIAFSGDVTKMYRQINIDPDHTRFLRIFWREDSSKPLRVLELVTVTYGTAAAPFLATRCLVQLATEEQHRFPVASKMVLEDMYVDDMLSGADSEEEAAQRLSEVKELLSGGGFPIRKWSSNSSVVLESVPKEERERLVKVGESGLNEGIKALGVFWDTKNDKLTFENWPEEAEEQRFTKRYVLSQIAKLYDPLGLVQPVIVCAKIVMQKLWSAKMNWEDELEGDLLNEWLAFRKSLTKLNQIQVPRCVKLPDVVRYEVHGFSDASITAYGACVYLRSVLPDGTAVLRLMCAKSRVAPLKPTTIPRMELLASLVLAQLVIKVIKALKIDYSEVLLWCDSQIVLAWLHKPLGSLEVYVRNRVAKINKITSNYVWKYVNSRQNPADVVSRGQFPMTLCRNTLWWDGPEFLHQEQYRDPDHRHILESEIPELKVATATVERIEILPVFERFSSFRKLQRVIAYVLRFVRNCQHKSAGHLKSTSFLSVPEMRAALNCIVKVIQMLELPDEIRCLERGQMPHRLANLSPFLDEENLMRVGGRLQKSCLPFETKHPLLLPSNSLSEMIIRALHVENLHVGPSGLLGIVRQTFWPLKGQSTIKKVTRGCIPCFRSRPQGIQQLMGSLPEERVNEAAPFEYTGVDYAGPVSVKQGKYRPKVVKCYIAVFVCMVTKNLHLELVSDLTTTAFIAALERFINRRGPVRKMFSDNGTNFVGASNELHQLFTDFRSEAHCRAVNDFLLPREIEWHFIPPRGPHFGGLWEAGVKSVKTHLRRTLQTATLTFEEYCTVLTHVEAILNSRPLFSASDSPDEPLPITPAHLQIGRPLVCIPKPSCTGTPDNRLSRWRYLDKLREHFWGRWSREYLTSLQSRSKWTATSPNVQPGTVVLLIEDNLPPQVWKLGIVTATYPGPDSLVRVVDVKTSGGTFRRSISKLAPLPTMDNFSFAAAGLDVGGCPST